LRGVSPIHLDKINKLNKIKSNITILNTYLDLAEYHSIYRSLDAVILPYRQQYVGRGSGILDEAIHFKKIVFCHENLKNTFIENGSGLIEFFRFDYFLKQLTWKVS